MTENEITISEIDPEAPVQSPFLPGTNIMFAWDSTCLGLLKTCPRLYQYIIIDGWSSNEESVHLYFGREYHQALQEYDIHISDGVSHKDAFRQVIQDLLIRTVDWAPDEDTKAGKYKNRKSLIRTVCWYLDKFPVDKDPCETFLLEDGRPAVELSFRFELDWGPEASDYEKDITKRQPYLLSGHLDRVVTYNDEIFVMDQKTTQSSLGDYFFSQFEPNNQMTLYSLAAKVILDAPVKGVIISGAQLLIDTNEFKRGFTYRTDATLDEWTKDLAYWFNIAESFATQGYWPMNDTACDKFGGCRFREICSKSPQVRDVFLKTKFTKLPEGERWNPLKPR